ncbi:MULTISPECIES: IS110 family transposase [Streptosporangium]|uniref:Transposase n=1 Tax=Streptosporangium brasiliense TaxID=47480 RepID=A0ABT9RCA6_9ACTN|nr:IS110 family transposase [Streptosporangium brasiliense]MDP9866020.1 transposase [Streptosporangium brasiliense]
MRTDYDGIQYVGMDLHRHRSVLVSMTADGERLWTEKIDNSPAALRQTLAQAGPEPKVVLEATHGWYWATDTLQTAGAEVHLAHPLGVKAFTYRRVKNDRRDAADLADLLRMNRLPEAWIAPEPVRQLRELTRYRIKLVRLRAGGRDQIHAILAKRGIPAACRDIFGTGGRIWLQAVALPQPYAGKLGSLLRLTDALTDEIGLLEEVIADLLAGHAGYRAIQACDGIGPILAAVIVAEVGDVRRFKRPEQLASWAGLTPRHRESDCKVARGHITKQGPPTLRWALVEAVQRVPATSVIGQVKAGILARRSPEAKSIAKIAAARELLELVFYGLRDGRIRRLERHRTPAAGADTTE